MKTYISGQITGLDIEVAKQNFNEAALFIKEELQSEFVNPFDLFTPEEEETFTWEEFMERDLEALKTCNSIYMLKGWENSRGARRELRDAIENGLSVIIAN